MSQKLRIGRHGFDSALALPALSTPWADAYEADPHSDFPNGLYALVQKHKYPPRLDVIEGLSAGKAGIMQPILEYEVVKMGGIERLGFMLERLPGPALIADLAAPFSSYKEDDIRQNFLRPMFDTLVTLQERLLFHGAISPLHIYAKAGLSGLILGECASLPPGYRQPGLFEPIERAQCGPVGKGDSTIEDDIYALGVSAYLLAIGKNPFASLSEEDLIRARIEAGSSTLMLNSAKLPPGILEFVRGVCADHPKQRWNFGEMESWLAGQRVAPRNVTQGVKASRALELSGKEYYRARNLADALPKHPAEARRLVETKEIARWLQRSLGDNPLHEAVNDMIEKVQPGQMSDELLASRLAMALDWQGPIRYKNLRCMPQALGTMLAHAVINRDTSLQQTIAEIISSDLITYWTTLTGNGSTYLIGMAKDVDQARGYLHVAGLGYGVERALYELQRHAPCYSDLFSRHYLLSLKQLLPALDELATDARRPTEPLDKHTAAFLAARMGRAQDNLLKALNPNKELAVRNIAVLNLLANVQGRYGVEPLPRLCAWMAETLKPALDRFHSRKLRQNLQNNLNKMADRGELAEMQRAVDSPEVVEGDLQGFRQATQQYRHFFSQIREVDVLLENKNQVGLVVGQRLAAAVAVAMGLVAAAAAIARAVGG